ncbi:MAG: SDR family oxidoreductase [Gammaproteobacteria bacterium]|nr:SDR family oxidoreductase [Gammaproteobacteria bacterium]
MGRLEGKTIIITGGASGVGEAAARLFASEGAKLVIADLQGERANQLAEELGGDCIAQKVDVSRSADVKGLVSKALESFGQLDVMFNNAGIGGGERLIHETPEELFDRTIAVNLKAVWLGIKHAIPPMLDAGSGSIMNTASVSAHLGLPQQGAYGASKSGVVQLTRVAAVEYADRRIRVNAICPGGVLTPMVYNNPALRYTLDPADAEQRLAQAQPLPRACQPIDIAHAALYLASDESSFVTGTTIVVDGGWTASGRARMDNPSGLEDLYQK